MKSGGATARQRDVWGSWGAAPPFTLQGSPGGPRCVSSGGGSSRSSPRGLADLPMSFQEALLASPAADGDRRLLLGLSVSWLPWGPLRGGARSPLPTPGGWGSPFSHGLGINSLCSRELSTDMFICLLPAPPPTTFIFFSSPHPHILKMRENSKLHFARLL